MAQTDDQLSMKESVIDLEAIRPLDLQQWSCGGHSTGGMLGLVYAEVFPDSLTKMVIGGTSASSDYMGDKSSMYSRKCPIKC
ncbi:alpha/beta hydrolase [Evansella halocellulosilytica]|uniref:alpha/beta hydrolase n=1 Tax=Evansella halocellulosilytica TaxID=2011013 RepID=UPI00211BB90B|nr:alpha/beta hydrolase [Evansella halocellulosilytica]